MKYPFYGRYQIMWRHVVSCLLLRSDKKMKKTKTEKKQKGKKNMYYFDSTNLMVYFSQHGD